MKITIIGAGSWGTTLALLLSEKKYDVQLWARSQDVYDGIRLQKQNIKYTSDRRIPENVSVFHQISDLCHETELIVLAVPTNHLRETVEIFLEKISRIKNQIRAILNVAKGIELHTNRRLSQVLKEVLPENLHGKIAVMSGPNISCEVLKSLPSVTTIASEQKGIMDYLQKVFSCDYFRVYTNADIVGVEVAGAVKNIIAIAAGISDGLCYGSNAKASLITRGLHEMSKLGKALGANPLTFSGIAGMGDLIATCISPHSRNRSVGEKIAQGIPLEEINQAMYMVAEGVKTTKAVYEISRELSVEMPVTESLYRIIYEGYHPNKSVNDLMKRKFKPEIEL